MAVPIGGNVWEPVRTFIKEQLAAQPNVASVAVAVAQRGQILWEEAFGWADRDRRVPATEHTVYSLASVSKPFTATALMALCEQGAVDLELPINRYLGAATLKGNAGDADRATVRRVANHTAGLPTHFQFFFEDEPYRPPGMEETIRRYGNIVLPPGEHFLYSNLGYGILGHLIERVSGHTFGAFLRTAVLEPLHLTHTFVDGDENSFQGQVAVRYGKDGSALPAYTTDHPGASAVFASVHDLVRFGMFHISSTLFRQAPILSPDAIQQMQHPASAAAPDQVYGLGWFLGRSILGQESLAHGGGMDGVSTRLYLIPAEQVVIVVLSNADSEFPGQVFREIMPTLFGDAAREKSKPEGQRNSQSSVSDTSTVAISCKSFVGRWRGHIRTYAADVPIDLDFDGSGDSRVRLGKVPTQIESLQDVTVCDNVLMARFNGNLGTPDADRLPHDLRLLLRLPETTLHSGDAVLTGFVTARSLSGKRMGNALSHWMEAVVNRRAVDLGRRQ